jgi:hypothetical protein
MSISTHVIGQRTKDKDFEKYFNILKACKDADIRPPKEVIEYFGDECLDYTDPDYIAELALEVDLDSVIKTKNADGSNDYIIDIASLPKSVVSIIFRIAW